MGLSNNEVVRLRAELGYDAVQVANPYLTAYSLFETIIKTYVEDGGETTSSTAVTASSSGAPIPVTLTLAAWPIDSNGQATLARSDRVLVDVDGLLEKSTVRNANQGALTIEVLLKLAHTGTYRVMVDGGVAMVREKLGYIRDLTDRIQKQAKANGVAQIDELKFHSPKDMAHYLGPAFLTWQQREKERAELANFLGVYYLRAARTPSGAGGGMVVV